MEDIEFSGENVRDIRAGYRLFSGIGTDEFVDRKFIQSSLADLSKYERRHSMIDSVTVFCPNDFLQYGVEFIDFCPDVVGIKPKIFFNDVQDAKKIIWFPSRDGGSSSKKIIEEHGILPLYQLFCSFFLSVP